MKPFEDHVARFLEFACWDHHVHGKGDHYMYDRAAMRLLAQRPDIARDSIYTAIVCGARAEVERILADRPEAARESGGSRAWTPLLYLCYTRFSHQPTIDNAVSIGRALLDCGADPNAYYMAGDARYSALVGVAGAGEQDSPRQPQAKALYQLLLERGAGPYDIQVLYNTHFSSDVLWWLELTYAHAVQTGRTADWDDPNWSMLDMGGYGPGAHFLLGLAIQKNDLPLAEWLLAHGASPTVATPSHPKFRPAGTLYQEALRLGLDEMADLLVRYGATPGPLLLDDTPLGYAAHFWHQPMIAFLSRFSRDIWNLAFTGCVERLRDVLNAEPGLARAVSPARGAPLWWLPDDEEKALAIVELFLTHGADPSIRTKEGRTAADWALTRGMMAVAQRLG